MVTNKQLSYLQNMGIDVWQRREGFYTAAEVMPPVENRANESANDNSINDNASHPTQNNAGATQSVAVAAEQASTPQPHTTPKTAPKTALERNDPAQVELLLQQQFIGDLLQALNIDRTKLRAAGDHIELAHIHWHLNASSVIEYTDGILRTPSLNNLQQHASLKQQLWQQLCNL